MQTVTLRVSELKAQTQYGKNYIGVEPVGEILYEVEVPDGYKETEGGVVFDANGMRHVLRGLQVILSFSVIQEDF